MPKLPPEKHALRMLEMWNNVEASFAPEHTVLRVLAGRATRSYPALCKRCGQLFTTKTALAMHRANLMRSKVRHAPTPGHPNVGLFVALACRALAGAP